MNIFIDLPNHVLTHPTFAALAGMGHWAVTPSLGVRVDRQIDAVLVLDPPINHTREKFSYFKSAHVVYVSTTDVYLASAVHCRWSNHAPSLAVLNEDSPVHENPYLRSEQFFRDQGATIVRLPRAYGNTGDLVADFLAPMDAKRPAILLDPEYANWKCSLSHVENIAHALALCLTNENARGQVFNLSEPRTPTIAERAHQIARFAKYRGPILALPRDRVPANLVDPTVDFRQDLIVSSDKIRRTLGYIEPIDTDEAIRRTIAQHRESPLPFNPRAEVLASEDALLRTLGIIR